MQHAMIKPRSPQAQAPARWQGPQDRAMHSRADGEDHVAAALFDPLARVPAAIGDAFGIRGGGQFCSNDITALLIRALAARYPVVRRLAGDDSFLATARRFVLARPPHLSAVLHFGDLFPRYLRGLGSEASFQYLADVAELEAARARALRSADAAPVDASRLLALSAGRHNDIGIVLHPSVSFIASRFPIVTVWAANQTDDGDGIIHQWGPEAALVARPFLDVDVMRLPPGGHRFLSDLAEGATIATAIASATLQEPAFDLTVNLKGLIDTSIVTGFHRCGGDGTAGDVTSGHAAA
jgi:Putative DNA-binding domain